MFCKIVSQKEHFVIATPICDAEDLGTKASSLQKKLQSHQQADSDESEPRKLLRSTRSLTVWVGLKTFKMRIQDPREINIVFQVHSRSFQDEHRLQKSKGVEIYVNATLHKLMLKN